MTIRLRGEKPIELETTKNYLSMYDRQTNMEKSLFNNSQVASYTPNVSFNSQYSGLAPSGGSSETCGNSMSCVA